MSTHVYANLAPMGWTDLTDDDDTKMGINNVSPYIWWEESADLYAPLMATKPNTAYELPYVNISYKGRDYRVSPYHLQIVWY
ncbi:hypothetical protein [Paucilactobacillus nenjiangensis]|uniref:hypothetical protein n=1 Tax=Paucilactobacillus nenjiangensis TaxID=1296540 RepID=UPI003BB545C5